MVQNVRHLQDNLYFKYQKNGQVKYKLYVAWIMRAHAHSHIFHTHPSGHFKAQITVKTTQIWGIKHQPLQEGEKVEKRVADGWFDAGKGISFRVNKKTIWWRGLVKCVCLREYMCATL